MKISSQLESKIEFYNGDKITSLRDKNDRIPGLRVITGNRSSGKTTYFNTRAMKRFYKNGSQTAFLYRNINELKKTYERVFKPIEFRFDPKHFRVSAPSTDGYTTLYVEDKIFGYGIALRACDNIKKVSNLFNNVDEIIWDEFQSVSGNYLPDEIGKFLIVYDSIARGENQMVRPVPVIAISNLISMLNPLMTKLKIFNNVDKDTKFMRGDGFVFEQNINLAAVQLRNNDPVRRALGEEENPEAVYLDNTSNIGRLKGKNKYFITLFINNGQFGVRWYENGLVSCTKKIDKTCRFCYTNNIEMADRFWTYNNDIPRLRMKFQRGEFVFEDLECRQAMIDFLKY